MKILFCIQLLIEMDHPWLYTNFLTNYFKRYIEELRQVDDLFEAAILMGEAPAMIHEKIPGVRTYVVSQNQMTCNGRYPYREVLREYFRYCHERVQEPEFLAYHTSLIKALVDFEPDIIISRDNAPYLERCFPEALMLYTEVGFVSRKPFPQTMYFDSQGMNCGSYLHRFWSQIEPKMTWSPRDRERVCELKAAVRSCVMKHNPYGELIRSWRQKFSILYLLPLQFSGFSNIDAEIGFESQWDVLTYVLDSVPSHIGIVVTTHPDYNVLNAGVLKFLRRKYLNLLYSEAFLDYNASSQYLLGLVDGVINLSSTVGLQTLFWDIPCISLGKYFASYISRPFHSRAVYSALSEEELERNDKVLFWLMTRYIVPAANLWNGKKLYDFLTCLSLHDKERDPAELYPEIASADRCMEAVIQSLRECAPEPRGRLLRTINESAIRNTEGKKRILVFGTGVVYRRSKARLKEYALLAFLDNNLDKQGTVLDGARIVSPAEAVNYCYDAVLLLSDAHEEMKRQLIGYGVSADKLYTAEELGRWQYIASDREIIRKEYTKIKYEIVQMPKKTVLLVSNQMDYTGAPIVLLYAARILKRNGFHVVVCSSKRGELEYLYSQEKISFLFEPLLNQYNPEFWDLAEQCHCLLINTLLEKELVLGIKNTKTKCIWWIHESDDRCKEADQEKLVAAFGENLSIYGVGKRVVDTFAALKTWDRILVHNLPFGIPDKRRRKEEPAALGKTKKTKILLAGSIYSVKGQDLFAQAINLLPEEVQNKCEFFLIGNILSEEYYEQVVQTCPRLKYLGVKDREEMQLFYADIDILVCPSRRDSLPVVTIEAMMHEKLVIVSDCTGTAHYIKQNVNGFVFEKENVRQLADLLSYVIAHTTELKQIGGAARKTFETNFSMEVFEQNLMRIMHDEQEKR